MGNSGGAARSRQAQSRIVCLLSPLLSKFSLQTIQVVRNCAFARIILHANPLTCPAGGMPLDTDLQTHFSSLL
ncbi:hypothetical protein DZA55_14040 [Xanthomonas oryzae pv. oryzae]|nr:hypothetical protein DZA55_14040 [Xanthomonas oryzae pv. oryzae]